MYVPLPEPRPTAGQRQPLPGWPLEPAPRYYEVELYGEADPIVHVPDPYNPNQSVAVRRSAVQPVMPYPPRDLSPVPLIDPKAQQIAARGVFAAGVGWGAGQLFIGAGQLVNAAVAGGAYFLWIAIALAAYRIAPALLGGRGGGDIYVEQHVTNNVRGFGRSTTNL